MLEDRVVEQVLEHLAEQERAGGVAYLAESPIAPGTRLEFPRLVIEVLRPSWLAFIDGNPDRDWGHPCRYLLIDDETGDVRSYAAQFPPFRPAAPWRWRVINKLSTLPNTPASS